VPGETLERLQELRLERHQQRKNLEALMKMKQKIRDEKVKEKERNKVRPTYPLFYFWGGTPDPQTD